MKLSSLTVPSLLQEMAAKKVCPVCGHGMVNYHFYYKGGFKCKSTSLAAPDVAAAKQSAADLIAAGYPATLDGLKAQTNGIAPSAMGTPAAATATKPKSTSTKASAPTAPVQPQNTYVGDQQKIANWLTKNGVHDFTINDDNTVDVNGDLNLDGLRHDKLPVKFGSVTGSVSLVGSLLRTLVGLPDEIKGDLDITTMELDSTDGFPMKVYGDVHIGSINVKSTMSTSRLSHVEGDLVLTEYGADSFVGLPEYVGGNFMVSDCPQLKSLKGMPKEVGGDVRFPVRGVKSLTGLSKKIGGDLDIVSPGYLSDTKALSECEIGGYVNLSVIGSLFDFNNLPRHIHGHLSIQTNTSTLQSLDGFPDVVDGDVNINMVGLDQPGKYNKFIKKMNGTLRIGMIMNQYDQDINISYKLVGKNLLSIPLIKGIKAVVMQSVGYNQPAAASTTQISTMLNRCIQGDIDIHELQEQLIDAGFGQMARL